jgi:hypothetical protein
LLIPLGAGALSALCSWFSWRAFQGCRAIEQGARSAGDADPLNAPHENDELELALLARERKLQLGLAKRNVQALGRVALFGGTGLSFLAFSGGGEYDLLHLRPALLAFGAGMLGWAACGEIHRRVGSLADSWRAANAKSRRPRQGVDPSERTG